MSGLFTTYKIKDLELKNRIVMAPMCMNMAVYGYANEWHKVHYATRAIGGVGLIILEATAVSPEGRIEPNDLGIWSDEHILGLKAIVDLVHGHDSKIGIQLGHAGRKASLKDERLVGPSDLRFSEDYGIPETLSEIDIKKIVEDFKSASRRALEAGFDMIEIHGAHGYLINQFMSPLSNKRSDKYGGTLENRIQFLIEILEGVKTVWPEEKPIFIRVSAEEYDLEGNTTEDIAAIINIVKEKGIDVVDVSSGGIIPKQITTYPGYQLEIGKKIKTQVELPVIVGGLIIDSNMAEEIICNQRGDLVYLGRELLRNPYWTLSASKQLEVDIKWPESYERSKTVRKNGF